jgi:hypothetical protein
LLWQQVLLFVLNKYKEAAGHAKISDERWACDLSFLFFVTGHFNSLSKEQQVKGNPIMKLSASRLSKLGVCCENMN